MFRLGNPRAFGGFGAGVRTCMEVTAELARGDGSAAWITMVYTGGSLGVLIGPGAERPGQAGELDAELERAALEPVIR
jgi:alkylation response protein AidB-like acyl-CoA dehydrogenase